MRRFCTLIVCSVFSLIAQTDRATLTGVVMDESRSVVPAAKIALHAEATGLNYNGLTNASGAYTFSGLPVGRYSLAIEKPDGKWVRLTDQWNIGDRETLINEGEATDLGELDLAS